jgi:myo-inositol catabolism protein IolS
MNNKSNMTSLGLGCWPLGGDQWGTQDDKDSVDTLVKAYESGIRHFDTAQMYGRGHAEELLGKTLMNERDNIFIATKILYTPKDKVEEVLCHSLRRLMTDYVDLIYIHWPKKNSDLAGMMDGLENARRKGLVRYIGVSNFSSAQMLEVMRAGRIDYHQLCYNLLWRREERETISFCRENGVEIVTYSSLAEGILTGKFGSEPDFPKGDHRKNTVLFDKAVWPHVFRTVERLKKAAEGAGRPLAHCALRWLMSRRGVSSVLAGCRTPLQVIENVRVLEGTVEDRVLNLMTEISDELVPLVPDEGNIFRWYP